MAETTAPEMASATAPSVEMADQPGQPGETARKRTNPTDANSTLGIDGTLAAARAQSHDAKEV